MGRVRIVLCLTAAVLAGLGESAIAQDVEPLRVSDNGRVFVTQSGKPFFWLGDTAWALFHRLDEREAERYYADRAKKGFTVIQAHVLDWSHNAENANGDRPFIGGDFDRPASAYWKHVDRLIGMAAEHGLYLALLPAWARSYVEREGVLKDQPDKAYRYGRFIGSRYRGKSHIIWVLGGDCRPTRHEIYDRTAQGLTEGFADGGSDRILMSYHPPGGTYRPPATSTGEFYHDKPWLDFNMIQSGHRIGNRNYLRIAEDYSRMPAKPTIESEPCYEDHPVKHDYKNGRFEAWHMRRRAYWALFAGACGYTYGGNGIWQMDKPGQIRKESHHHLFWYDALDLPGAGQMKHIRTLMESRPLINPVRIPDQSILLSPHGW